jgi:hypothetical protein
MVENGSEGFARNAPPSMASLHLAASSDRRLT